MLRVYVGNLPYKVRDQELKDYFEQNCGPVKEAVVPLNGDRRSMGFGFVEFETDEAFQKALSMSGTEMDGRPLRIDAARPKEDRGSAKSEDGAKASPEETKEETTDEVAIEDEKSAEPEEMKSDDSDNTVAV